MKILRAVVEPSHLLADGAFSSQDWLLDLLSVKKDPFTKKHKELFSYVLNNRTESIIVIVIG